MLLVGVCALVTFRPSLPPAHPHLMAQRILDCSRASSSLFLSFRPPLSSPSSLCAHLTTPTTTAPDAAPELVVGVNASAPIFCEDTISPNITCGPSTEALYVSRVKGNYECFAEKVWGIFRIFLLYMRLCNWQVVALTSVTSSQRR